VVRGRVGQEVGWVKKRSDAAPPSYGEVNLIAARQINADGGAARHNNVACPTLRTAQLSFFFDQSRRWRELGMSSFSRYLVTVRRATLKPRFLSRRMISTSL
jgi:hypothetical protein